MMERTITHESRFSRTLNNHARLGAYYTDVAHCAAIAQLLEFPEEDVLCLEPSVGDGEAIIAAVRKEPADNKHIYAVEISRETADETSKNKLIEGVLCADFLTGVNISPNSFGFCFSNPPYMVQDGVRLEDRFLDRITNFLKKDGVLVYVIPYTVFSERGFFRKLYNRYQIRYVYRFHEEEYAKWRQVVVVATKRSANAKVLKDELDAALMPYLVEEDLPLLPFRFDGEKVKVPASNPDMLKTFTTTVFPAEACLKSMNVGYAKEVTASFNRSLSRRLSAPTYSGDNLGRPPIHPNKDSMYLLGVCGAGSGLCGNEEEGNLHLQRGVVKMVEDLEPVYDPEKDSTIVKATNRAKVTYNVIQQDGSIVNLE